MQADADSLSTWVEAFAAVGTLLVSLLAAAYALREHRNSRENIVQQMRTEWGKLQPAWSQILLAEHGPDFHYADASNDERLRAQGLHQALRSDGLEPGYSAARELRAKVRPVTRFLSYAADSVIRGRWRMSEAYEVFGPDVARHHKTIRMLAHRRNDVPTWLEQSTEFNNFDEQDCVLLFAFLMRAEQCRRGDTYPHLIVELAKEMRGPFRAELKRCVRRTTRVRKRFLLPVRVKMLLWRGRHPRLAAAYMSPTDPIISGSDRRLFRRPLEPMLSLRFRVFRARKLGGH